jgi:hypothetical protein
VGRGPARQVPTPPNIGADSVSPRGACCRVASNIDWNPGFSPSPLRGDFTATFDPTIDVTGRGVDGIDLMIGTHSFSTADTRFSWSSGADVDSPSNLSDCYANRSRQNR